MNAALLLLASGGLVRDERVGAGARYDGLKLDEECGNVAGYCSEPCEREYVWLDTPRQSCRYPEAYKLEEAQVDKFLVPELDRLVDKSRTFASKGCLFGGWMRKCYRRMRQIIRLQTFINEVDPAKLATPENAAKLEEVRENMKTGFTTWEANHEGEDPPCIVNAFKMMTLASDEVSQVEAFLAVSCNTLSDDEKADLQERFDTMDRSAEDTDTKKFVGLLTQDLDGMMDEGGVEQEDAVERADTTLSPEGELTHGEDEAPLGGAAAVAVGAEADLDGSLLEEADSSLAEFGTAMQGGGPIKWLVTRPFAIFPWFFTRIAWLLLFTGSFLWNTAKAAVGFPISTIFCLLIRFADWFFVDLVYKGGWEGKWDFAKTYKKMGMCPVEMWDFWVGKDIQGSKFFTSPANWASRKTGVWHVYKDVDPCGGDPCSNTPNSRCYMGTCYCNLGHYTTAPAVAGGPNVCQLAATTAQNCMCAASWQKKLDLGQRFSNFVGWSSPTAVGCHEGRCQTDPKFNNCGAVYTACGAPAWVQHYNTVDPAPVAQIAGPVPAVAVPVASGARTWTGAKRI